MRAPASSSQGIVFYVGPDRRWPCFLFRPSYFGVAHNRCRSCLVILRACCFVIRSDLRPTAVGCVSCVDFVCGISHCTQPTVVGRVFIFRISYFVFRFVHDRRQFVFRVSQFVCRISHCTQPTVVGRVFIFRISYIAFRATVVSSCFAFRLSYFALRTTVAGLVLYFAFRTSCFALHTTVVGRVSCFAFRLSNFALHTTVAGRFVPRISPCAQPPLPGRVSSWYAFRLPNFAMRTTAVGRAS